MGSAAPANVRRPGLAPYSAAQVRTATVALDLITTHGVSGTSLQMIADALGVTKAAVYHQFKRKEAIVVAAVELELRRLEPALDAAERGDGGPAAIGELLRQVIDLAVGRRSLVSTLQHDPVIARLLAEHEPFEQYMQRLFRALLGGSSDAGARVRVAMVASAIGGAVSHPLVTGLDDATVRSELLDLSLQVLGPGPGPGH